MRKQGLCGALAALVLVAALTVGSAAYAAPPAAQLWTLHPEWTADEVRAALFNTAQAVGGWRVLDPQRTLAVCTAAFSDVPEGAWYAGAVRWAVVAGVTNGVGEGRFAPDEHCTRAQIVTFLWRSYNG